MLRQRRMVEIAGGTALLFFVIVIATSPFGHTERPWTPSPALSQSPISARPYVKPSPLPWHPPKPQEAPAAETQPREGTAPDRIIVVAKLAHEDTRWVRKELGKEWQVREIVMDQSFALLHYGAKRVDTGRVASAYLAYLIENYNQLPSSIVFLKPTRYTHAPKGSKASASASSVDKVSILKSLDATKLAETGFTNLHCTARTYCLNTLLPFRKPPDEYRTLEVAMPRVWNDLFNPPDPKNSSIPNPHPIPVPEKLSTPLEAGEFVVSRGQVKKRAVGEYVRYWEWVNRVIMDDETAGRVMEGLWHIVFGKEAVYCPELGECECVVGGVC